jgi:hypothetical protein
LTFCFWKNPQCASSREIGLCTDFTLDKCSIELDGILETVKSVPEVNCQKYCSLVYPDLCEFFIQDRKQDICYLMRQTLESYVRLCRKSGGPAFPSIHDCSQNSTETCDVSIIFV